MLYIHPTWCTALHLHQKHVPEHWAYDMFQERKNPWLWLEASHSNLRGKSVCKSWFPKGEKMRRHFLSVKVSKHCWGKVKPVQMLSTLNLKKLRNPVGCQKKNVRVLLHLGCFQWVLWADNKLACWDEEVSSGPRRLALFFIQVPTRNIMENTWVESKRFRELPLERTAIHSEETAHHPGTQQFFRVPYAALEVSIVKRKGQWSNKSTSISVYYLVKLSI